MVKERKPQGGTSNLSARRTTPFIPDATKTTSDELWARKSTYRSPTHQLIAPDLLSVPTIVSEKQRTIDSTSVWNGKPPYSRDFSTTYDASYIDPSSIPHKDLQLQTTTGERSPSFPTRLPYLSIYLSTNQSLHPSNKQKSKQESPRNPREDKL